jgi:hypothetical protein
MHFWDRRARGKLPNNIATNTSGPARATTSATPNASSLLASTPESDVIGDTRDAVGSAFVDSIIESAINNFFKDLSPDDQALFKATTISTQLLEDVQNADKRHQEHSVTRRVATVIKPFVAGVEHYGTAWDVISNSNSLICPIWGSARIILKWASEFGDYFENLAVMFSQIGRHLVGIKRYPTLYPDNNILQLAMVDIFRAIFEFLTKAAAVFREGQKSQGVRATGTIGLAAALKVFWKPFKVQFGDLIDRICRSMQDIETEVEIAEKELAGKERQKAEAERVLAQQERDAAARARSLQVQERFRRGAAVAVMERAAMAWSSFIDEKSAEKVNAWLAPANVASNHNAATKARHADSGSWFLEGNTFQQWVEQCNSFLWLYAIRKCPILRLEDMNANSNAQLAPVKQFSQLPLSIIYRNTNVARVSE